MDLSTIEYYSTQRRYGFKFHLFNSDSLIALPNPQVKEETSKFDVRQIFFAIFDKWSTYVLHTFFNLLDMLCTSFTLIAKVV